MRDLPEGWIETTLGEVSLSKQYGYTESASTEKVGPKFLRITDIQHDFIDWNVVPYCPISEKDKLKYKLDVGDVVIARTGNSTGATATIKDSNIDAVFASYLIRFKIDPQIADYNFIDFSLRSQRWKGFVKSVKGGSAQGGANANNFAEYPISLPPLPEQKAIAEMLSSFDEKIELLREQNKTLETLAQTIFKEWFVHFNFPDPHGKPYRNNGGAMVESELGLIPQGWRVGCIGDVLALMYGKTLKTEDRTGNGFPVYGSNGIVGFHKDYLVEGAGIIVGRKGSMGTVIWSFNSFYPIDTAFYVVDKHGLDVLFFHYFLLKRFDFERIGSDSAVPGLNREAAYSIEIVIPEVAVIKKFNTFCDSIFNKRENNTQQIQTLSKTRDALLPKLMSGQVRIEGVYNDS